MKRKLKKSDLITLVVIALLLIWMLIDPASRRTYRTIHANPQPSFKPAAGIAW